MQEPRGATPVGTPAGGARLGSAARRGGSCAVCVCPRGVKIVSWLGGCHTYSLQRLAHWQALRLFRHSNAPWMGELLVAWDESIPFA